MCRVWGEAVYRSPTNPKYIMLINHTYAIKCIGLERVIIMKGDASDAFLFLLFLGVFAFGIILAIGAMGMFT